MNTNEMVLELERVKDLTNHEGKQMLDGVIRELRAGEVKKEEPVALPEEVKEESAPPAMKPKPIAKKVSGIKIKKKK